MKQLLILLCLVMPVLAKDSSSVAKGKWKKWLSSMQSIEAKARPVQPMHIPLAKQTPAQRKEIEQRVEFLDKLIENEVNPLCREIARYADCPDGEAGTHALVRKASEDFSYWMSAKLTLQNAGVNNPSLENLKQNEPKTYAAYQEALKAAQAAVR
jgi:hypothetical protein